VNPALRHRLVRAGGYWSVVVATIAVIGAFYLWQLRAAGYRFDWVNDQGGYYNYLGRALAHGRLELPIEPSPALLALPNPWDPTVGDSLKMQDMALYHGHYYLYHGPGPAVMLFTPWLLITGHDMPERFALFLLCFGGFVFFCGSLIRLLTLAGAKTPPLLLAVMLLALGICQSAPYLLSRVWVYEVAIAGGYFSISAAIFFLVSGINSSRSGYWLAASGTMFGMAIACRPHLGLAGAMAMGGLVLVLGKSRRLGSAVLSSEALAFALTFALTGAVVGLYNYLRFGDPFEFGIRYLLAGPNQNRINLAAENLLPGMYFWLACPPGFSGVFPWVRLALRPDYPLPPGYFIEPTAGALYLAPFVACALFVPSAGRRVRGNDAVRILLWTFLLTSAAILVFLAATGFTTQRYELDFLPLAVLVACANFGIYINRGQGWRRVLLCTALVIGVSSGAVVNMALAIVGPYDEMLKNRPVNYLRLARWFSPLEEFRPVLNPAVDVGFTAEFGSRPGDVREPLLTMGRGAWRYLLYVRHSAGRLQLVSQSDHSTVMRDVDDATAKPMVIRVSYVPATGRLTVWVQGMEFLTHDIGTVVTAPAEVMVGENRTGSNVTIARFTGRIDRVSKTITPH
jgi:hypothetical protein